VVYYGVPDFVQSGAEPKDSRKPKSDSDLIVAYVGVSCREKGVSTLIEAARNLQREGCRNGRSDYWRWPRTLAPRRARSCGRSAAPNHIHRNADRRRSPKRARRSGCARCALALEEPAGLVVMEQLMRGRPVIVSDNEAQRNWRERQGSIPAG